MHHGRTTSLSIQTPSALFNFFSSPVVTTRRTVSSSKQSDFAAADKPSNRENFSQHGLLIEKFPYYAPHRWPLRLAVRTAASHAVNTGSIPVGVNPSTPFRNLSRESSHEMLIRGSTLDGGAALSVVAKMGGRLRVKGEQRRLDSCFGLAEWCPPLGLRRQGVLPLSRGFLACFGLKADDRVTGVGDRRAGLRLPRRCSPSAP